MRRHLRNSQVWTSHDGTNLYRVIDSIEAADGEGPARVFYRTNRGEGLHVCQRSTFVTWLRVRRARKTQKNRKRSL